jgi:hypothetical protein
MSNPADHRGAQDGSLILPAGPAISEIHSDVVSRSPQGDDATMVENHIEPVLASPPEREELVVQLFVRGGGQWGEVFRDHGEFWIELYLETDVVLRFRVDAMLHALNTSRDALRERFG